MTLKGIDVSYAQGNIDWDVASKNVDFAMIRATAGFKSPGWNGIDLKWDKNIVGVEKYNVPYGIYHYSYAMNVNEAKKEAEHFLNTIKGHKPTYPVAFDFEDVRQLGGYDNKGVYHNPLPLSTQMDIIDAFMGPVENAGYYAVLYMSASPMIALMRQFKERMAFYDKWVAHIAEQPATTGGIWQYSWTGRVPGIIGNVDLDYAYKNYPHIIKSAGLNGWGKAQEKPKIETVPKSQYDTLKAKYDALYNGISALIERG